MRAAAAGASKTARKALGFDELLAGDVEGLKQRSRNYARRQLTWMRKMAGLVEIDVTELTPREAAERVAIAARRRRRRDPRKEYVIHLKGTPAHAVSRLRCALLVRVRG